MVNVSGKALAADIASNTSASILPAATALPLTIDLSSPPHGNLLNDIHDRIGNIFQRHMDHPLINV